MKRILVAVLGVGALLGCNPKGGDETAGGDASESGASTGTSSDESGFDDSNWNEEDGTSEECAMMSEMGCLISMANDGPCLPVWGTMFMQLGPGTYCDGDGDYLGCIDRDDAGCGVKAVCKDGVSWRLSSGCVPPGYQPCPPPDGEAVPSGC